MRRDGSGAKESALEKVDVYDSIWFICLPCLMSSCMHDVFQEYSGEISQLTLAHLCRLKGVPVSKYTVQKVFNIFTHFLDSSIDSWWRELDNSEAEDSSYQHEGKFLFVVHCMKSSQLLDTPGQPKGILHWAFEQFFWWQR